MEQPKLTRRSLLSTVPVACTAAALPATAQAATPEPGL